MLCATKIIAKTPVKFSGDNKVYKHTSDISEAASENRFPVVILPFVAADSGTYRKRQKLLKNL